MKKILLGGEHGIGKVMIVDDDDFELLDNYNWHVRPDGYAEARKPNSGHKGVNLLAHRLIMGTPKGMQTDHINGDRLDNQRNNLRIATHQQNQWNQKRSRGTSKFKGVCWDKSRSRWVAQICFNSKNMVIGRFSKEIQAALAYDLWAKDLFGKFASLNFKHGLD